MIIINAIKVMMRPDFIISFDFNNPEPKAMAFGGVLTGIAIEVEQTTAMEIAIKISFCCNDTAIGINKFAVAVLLINVVIKAPIIINAMNIIQNPSPNPIYPAKVAVKPLLFKPAPKHKPPPSINKMSQDKFLKSLT